MFKRQRMKASNEKDNGKSYEVFTTEVKELSKLGESGESMAESEKFLSVQTLGPYFYPEHTETKKGGL